MTITPKDWARFQHYKNRAPSWIKFHRSLLDNYDYARLPVASRALAPMLWLLASEYDEGKITATVEEIAFRLRTSVAELTEALTPLLQSGFFISSGEIADCKQPASTTLAECLPRVREEEEGEREKDAAPEGAQVVSISPAPDKVYFDQAAQYLGNNGRSLAAQLLKSKGNNIPAAHQALLAAVQKSNPREYIGAIIRGRGSTVEDLRARGEAW
jgi:hypothetical protein